MQDVLWPLVVLITRSSKQAAFVCTLEGIQTSRVYEVQSPRVQKQGVENKEELDF